VGQILIFLEDAMEYLNSKTIVKMTSLSRVTIWRLERDGKFPKRVQLSPRRVGWREDEIQEWISKKSENRNAYHQ
jgi:prophage regulatory protein